MRLEQGRPRQHLGGERHLEGSLQLQGEQIVVERDEVQGKFPKADVSGNASFLEQSLTDAALVGQEIHREFQAPGAPEQQPSHLGSMEGLHHRVRCDPLQTDKSQ